MITSEFGRTEDMYTFVLKPVTMDIPVAVNHCESPSWLPFAFGRFPEQLNTWITWSNLLCIRAKIVTFQKDRINVLVGSILPIWEYHRALKVTRLDFGLI